MQSIRIYPQLLTYKADKDKLCPIVIRVDIDSRKAGIESVKRKAPVEGWDSDRRLVKPSVLNAALINARIRDRIATLDREIQKAQLAGQRITAKYVKDLLKHGAGKDDFFTFCEKQIAAAPDSPSNKRHATKHLNKVRAFSPDVQFPDFNFAYFQRFENYLRKTLDNANNTAWADFKFLHHMFVVAQKMKVIDHNPLDDYQMPRYEETIPQYLEWAEVETIQKKLKEHAHLPDTLRRIGYSFLLQCCTGFRFGDVSRFRWEAFVKEGKINRMILHTAKNGEIVSIGFTTMIAEVAAVLRDSPLPKITNQDYNRQLKTLAIAFEIRPLSSHMGRHTFGMRCAELGMAIDDVQKLMGHTKRETTSIYFKIKDARLDEAMKVWG